MDTRTGMILDEDKNTVRATEAFRDAVKAAALHLNKVIPHTADIQPPK